MSRHVSQPKHCARCGRPLPSTRPRLYSSWTHTYYCVDIDVCARRARRLRRERETMT